jgi:hypothetical protein
VDTEELDFSIDLGDRQMVTMATEEEEGND